MAKKIFWLRMLAMALAFGMAVVGCDNGSTNGNGEKGVLDGTFINQSNNSYKIVIQGGSWTSLKDNVNFGRGTFTLSGNNVSGRSTHAWNSGTWVPYTDDTFSATMVEGGNSFTIITNTGWDQDFLGSYLRQ